MWERSGQPRANNNEQDASSDEGDRNSGVAFQGAMRDVALAIKGQGGVLDANELFADEGEGAVYRTALGHVIGGDFISHLMQVTEFF